MAKRTSKNGKRFADRVAPLWLERKGRLVLGARPIQESASQRVEGVEPEEAELYAAGAGIDD